MLIQTGIQPCRLVFGTAVRILLGMSTSHSRVLQVQVQDLFLIPTSYSCISGEAAGDGSKQLAPRHTHQRPKLGFKILPSVQTNPSCCEHLGSKTIFRRSVSLFLSHSLCLSNKLNKSFSKKKWGGSNMTYWPQSFQQCKSYTDWSQYPWTQPLQLALQILGGARESRFCCSRDLTRLTQQAAGASCTRLSPRSPSEGCGHGHWGQQAELPKL